MATLLDEAHDHLHNFLCASVLGRKLVTLAFHRNVQIDVKGARAMRACLNHCMKVRAQWG